MGIIEKQVAFTLALIIALAGVSTGYILIEPSWRSLRAHQQIEHSAAVGKQLFESSGCVTCHLANGYGTLQGGAGWPLNTTENQRGNETEMEQRRQLLTRVLQRGRGPVMVAYSREEGGSLNEEQINELVAFIQHGDWGAPPVEGAAAALVQGGATVAGGTAAGGAAGGSAGAQLFSGKGGCNACHQVKGQGGVIGPAMDGIGAKGADYIRESILNPNAVIAQGYQAGLMPSNYGQTLTPQEIDDLVAYLAELK